MSCFLLSRSCVGSRFAMEEMKVVLLRLLQRYSLQLEKPRPGEALPLQADVLLVPSQGLHMKLTLRGNSNAIPPVLDNEP